MITDYLKLGIKNIFHRQMRSWLTMIGIIIGVAAVVGLISLSQGLEEAVVGQMSGLGTDIITVRARSAWFAPPGVFVSNPLTTDDMKIIERVGGVDKIAGRILKPVNVNFNDILSAEFVASMPDTKDGVTLITEGLNLKVSEGRMLTEKDRKRIVVGNYVANKNDFERVIKQGDVLLMNNEKFKVIGVLKKTGVPFADQAFLMPEDDMRKLYDIKKEVSMFLVRVKKGSDIKLVEEELNKAFRKDRSLKEGEEDFEISTPQKTLESFQTIIDIVKAVFVGIAAISILVGGIGIMNTMYTSVLERTKEIGIMKAVGAKNSMVMFVFLIEAGLVGTVGGIMGIAAGIGMSKLVEITASQILGSTLIQAHISLELIIGALIFSFVIGSLSGILPALQASKLKPVDALRYE